MSFGDRIKNLRLEKNMTQEDLSKILNVSRATVGRYETNERFPDKNTLKKIADTFEVSIDYLFERTNIRNKVTSYTKSPNKSYSQYKIIENEIMKKLLLEKIINKEEPIPEKILENIIKYGIDAAIKIAKLEKRLEK